MTVAGLVPRARRLPCQPCWRAQARPGQARRRACLIKPRWNTSAPRCMPRASVHCYRHTDCGLPLETHYHLGCARRWVQGALGSMGPRAATGAKPRSLRLGLAPPTKPTHAPRNDKTTGNCPTQPRQESLHVQLGHPPHPPNGPATARLRLKSDRTSSYGDATSRGHTEHSCSRSGSIKHAMTRAPSAHNWT